MDKGLFTMVDSNPEAKEEEAAELQEDLPRPSCLKAPRLFIMIMLLILGGLLTVSTGDVAYRSPRLSVFIESQRKEIVDNTVGIFDDALGSNANEARSLAGMLEKQLLGDGTSLESFKKIRVASFSIFKAIPEVTWIGATCVNGLTGIFVRGGLSPIDGDTSWYIYTNSTEPPRPPFYIENVDMITGDAVAPPIQYQFREHFKDTEWLATTLSVPFGEISWHLSLTKTLATTVSVPFGEISWHLSPTKPCGRVYLQCGIPILTEKSEQLTVIHSSRSTDALIKYLAYASDLKGGHVFFVNHVGEIVFKSEGEDCVHGNKSESRRCEHQSDVVKALTFLESHMPVTQLVREEIHFTDVLLGGRRYSLDSWPHSFQGLNLAAIMMIPRHSFWGSLDYHTQAGWIGIFLSFLGFVFLNFFSISLFTEQVAIGVKLRAEAQRQIQAKRRAEASRDAKTAFLSHMSHELRTPVACIIGLLDVLMGELKMTEHQSSVRQVHRCATSLVALLNSALDIAKIEAGKLELEVAEFDLEAELTSLIEVFSVQCDAKGLQFALYLSDDIPKLVNGDAARVMQIFTNLIGNSIKFTTEGRIIVRGCVDTQATACTSSTSTSDRNQVVLKFEVDDTGPGIEKALRERLFENFVQGAVSVPRTHGGTGLGLGIVRSLVHLMGGDIKIGDKTGEGTVFEFALRFEFQADRKSSSYEVIKRREIILGMPDQDCRSVVAEWMEHRRLIVDEVLSWEEALLQLDIRGHLQNGRKIDNISRLQCQDDDGEISKKTLNSLAGQSVLPRRTRSDIGLKNPVLILDVDLLPRYSDENDYLQAFQKLGLCSENSNQQMEEIPGRTAFCKSAKLHAVVWVIASNTPDSLKNALDSLSRSTCRSLLVRRPLHPARLRELFSEVETRERNLQSKPRRMMSQNLKSSAGFPSVNIRKQLGVEVKTGDDSSLEKSDSVEGSTQVKESPVIEQKPGMKTTLETKKPEFLMPRNPLIRSHSDDTQKYVGKSEVLLASKPLKGFNVLVTEDHDLLCKLASTLLQRLGATPFLARNGQEAVSAVVTRFESGSDPFDCILMDCQMPVMNGYDASKAIREFERDKDQRTCIIALTANAMASDEKQCLLVGMDGFVTKPMEQERLVQVILSNLNAKRPSI